MKWFIFHRLMKMLISTMGSFRCLGFLVSFMLVNIGVTRGTICYETGNFTTNSTYEKNRNLILSSLASNVTLHDGFFYNATVGEDPDKVYALALCRGDSSPEQCTSCVSYTTQGIMKQCLNQKEAVAWGESPQCIIRYSNRSIFGKMEADPMARGSYKSNMITNMTLFGQTWESSMNSLLRKASKGSNNSSRKFATGEANLTNFGKIYALMQCTPDISESDCYYCLHQSVAFYGSYSGKPGCLIMRPSCMYIWSWSPFYEVSSASVSPSPILPQTKVPEGKGAIRHRTVIIIVISAVVIFIALLAFTCVILMRRKMKQEVIHTEETEDSDGTDDVESLRFDFGTIRAATNNFSIENKLGQGGFGVVYRGRLPDGLEIAVKRLSRDSGQGELEFKNEFLLLARLRHRNLVRLLGFCLQGNERLLIYEFVLNSSLDTFISDTTKRLLLDWKTRYKIISGIAWGILYLHEDSRYRIIHRDIKASNILLDASMTPKISDFGMARLFEFDQTQGNTSKIVGTFGYMAPEYIKHGQFSVKSDVFSFGVLVLEIISGQKICNFHDGEEPQDLLTYAWKNWNEGTAMNMIDPNLRASSSYEVMRCVHIGLLCVQENIAKRPAIASIVLMLTSCSLSLPIPSKPAFFMHYDTEVDNSKEPVLNQSQSHIQLSLNEVSITELDPR